MSQYKLIKDYGIDKAQLQRLRQNMVVKTLIIDRLCEILHCPVEVNADEKRGVLLVETTDGDQFEIRCRDITGQKMK